MKSRGLIDFYLPPKMAYHLKILVGSFFITIFFSLLWTSRPINENFWYMFVMVVIQLEIFMVIALRIFNQKKIKKGKTYKSQIITKLIVFYLTVIIIAFIIVFITISINMIFGNQNFEDVVHHFLQNELKGLLISWIIGITIGSLFFFYMEWNYALKREQKLKEEKLIFQYETLKNQVNPHFLFNSLNTLSSLVSKDSSLSQKFIAKFSSIYRYILENQQKDLVPLKEEIKFVDDFFFLQKIRDNGKIDLTIEIENLEKYEILPISLQLLIENALKHNAATKENPLKIRVSRQDDYLLVENNLEPKMRLEPSSKIGLKNLKERVKLVMNGVLTINQSTDIFSVKMPIKSI